ncbi:DUF397 domain-containing protein [Actinomadura macrotermitis]|uniref:DUF397 domain-containing protein n=1 Tax=Actinomadura macrotermitis TaxID=2585200 RepID=A0A7K0C741_9ACTN|nr:DUF397 domain-containing protein [Actinomadura macrotermitis]MQY09281.1 hypothetical protein [Actinomadura macrotermitis]
MNFSTPLWRKSSHSGGNTSSDCIEVAALSPEVRLRDSKDPQGPHLHLTRNAFGDLLTRIKARI